MNGQRCAGDRKFLTFRLRQSCDLAGSFGVITVFPNRNRPRLCGSLLAAIGEWDERL
jgi:hypothetical protein